MKTMTRAIQQEERLGEVTIPVLLPLAGRGPKAADLEHFDLQTTGLDCCYGELSLGVTPEMAAEFPAPGHQAGIGVRVVGWMLAAYGWLAGPPTSQREETRREIAEFEGRREAYFTPG